MNSLESIYSLPFFVSNTIPTSPVTGTNLRLWLDASDPSANGVRPTSDTNLSSWIDKSTYGNNTNALTTTDQSSTIEYQIAGFNSKPTFNFTNSGTNNGNRFVGTLPTSNSSNISGTSMRVFIVGSLNSSSDTYARFIAFSNFYKQTDYNNLASWAFLRVLSSGITPYRADVWVTDASNNPSGYSIPLIWSAWFNGTNAYTNFLNGTSTTTYSFGSSGNFNIQHFAIGNGTSPNQTTDRLNGKISEILVYNGTLDQSQVNQIEAYLAYKWGLQNTLPSTNPYRP